MPARRRPDAPVSGPRSTLAPLAGSLGLHAAVVLALAFATLWHWPVPSERVHAIEAYVARGARAPAPVAAPAPAAEAPAPVVPESRPAAPPPPDAAVERRAEAARAEAARTEARAAAQAKAELQAAADAEARVKADAAARAKAEQRAREQDDRKAEQAARAERQKAEAALAAEAAQARAEAKDRKARESDLARALAAEDHATAQSAAQAGLLARYKAELVGRVQRAWIRPPTARAGLKCTVHVTQVVGGTVTAVRVGDCNADAAVRQSIEAAVYRASPLPPPPDPSLFDRNLTLEFAPDA